MRFHSFKRNILFITLLLLAGPLFSIDFSRGYRVFASLGQGSGKGFWDQTDPHEEGRLYPLPGGGAALFGELEFSGGLILETALQYSFATAGQDVGSTEYRYRQHSFEIPLMIMKSPGNKRLAIGLGPTLIILPFEATRKRDESGSEVSDRVNADQKILLGLQAGGDFSIPFSERQDILLSFRFTHPLISPGYMWEVSGSGNYRINRFDFGIGMRTHSRKKEYEM